MSKNNWVISLLLAASTVAAAGYVWSIQRIMIFGDSTMLPIKSTSFPYRIINNAKGATTITQIEQAVVAAKLDRTFSNIRAVVIAGGVNDIIFGTEAPIDVVYRRLLSRIPEKTPVYLFGILPVREPNRFGVMNGAIMDWNAKIALVCRERPRCSMIGGVPPSMPQTYTDDGIHLNASGARVFSDLAGL